MKAHLKSDRNVIVDVEYLEEEYYFGKIYIDRYGNVYYENELDFIECYG